MSLILIFFIWWKIIQKFNSISNYDILHEIPYSAKPLHVAFEKVD